MHMPFTGERYVPELRGQIYYEHLHRYALAFAIARDRDVLDVASGEGYGAAYLAIAARSAVGVDLDPASVRHAASRYTGMNLSFRVGSCTAIPLPDSSIDLVVSFETLEHIDEHEKFMREILRVLRPDGELIISTPNKLVYSDHSNFENPFHVRELYFDEFRDLLRGFFPQVRVYGQRIVAGSAIHPLRGFAADARCISPTTHDDQRGLPALPAPTYFMAVCSLVDDTVRPIKELDSVFLDPRDDLLADIVNPEPLSGSAAAGDLLALEGTPPELLATFPGTNHSAEPDEAVRPADVVPDVSHQALDAQLGVERAVADDLRRRLDESEERRLAVQVASDHREVALRQLHEQLRAVGATDVDALALPQLMSDTIGELRRRLDESEALRERGEAETAEVRAQRDMVLEQLRGLLNSLGVSDAGGTAQIVETVSVAHARIHGSNASREHLLAHATDLESELSARGDAITALQRRLEEDEAQRQRNEAAATRQQQLVTAERDAALEQVQELEQRLRGASDERERLTGRVGELEAEAEGSSARIQYAREELAQERQRGLVLQEHIAAGTRSDKERERYTSGLLVQIAELEAALDEARHRIATDGARSEELARALRDVNLELVGSKARLEQARFQLEEIAASRSWRVTKPLRLAMRPFKRH